MSFFGSYFSYKNIYRLNYKVSLHSNRHETLSTYVFVVCVYVLESLRAFLCNFFFSFFTMVIIWKHLERH